MSPAERKASLNRVICAGRALPAGWVVIGAYHNTACPGEGDNALIIKRPGRREVVCSSSELPEGYRIVRPTRSDSCPGEGDNALFIERVGND